MGIDVMEKHVDGLLVSQVAMRLQGDTMARQLLRGRKVWLDGEHHGRVKPAMPIMFMIKGLLERVEELGPQQVSKRKDCLVRCRDLNSEELIDGESTTVRNHASNP